MGYPGECASAADNMSARPMRPPEIADDVPPWGPQWFRHTGPRQGLRPAAAGAWSNFDPRPRFELDRDGCLSGTNAAGERLLSGGVIALNDGRLRFGSPRSNRALERALDISRRAERQKVVLRTLDGVWRAGDVYAAPGDAPILLILAPDEVLHRDDIGALADAFELTRAEAQILDGLCTGLCPKEIAQGLNISEHTVRTHLRAIYGKLGVRGLSNAIRMASHLLA